MSKLLKANRFSSFDTAQNGYRGMPQDFDDPLVRLESGQDAALEPGEIKSFGFN